MDDARVATLLAAGGLPAPPPGRLHIDGEGPVLPYRHPIDEVAATAIGLVGAEVADLWQQRTGREQTATVEVQAAAAALASITFDRAAGRPALPWNPTVELYESKDSEWFHLHGALPHLLDGTLELLGCENEPDQLAEAVRRWDSADLEDTLAERGLCGAVARTAEQWAAHPQGALVTAAPLVELIKIADGAPTPLPADPVRPLDSVRVLELARILAAPVCGRTLAEHGADVLNVSTKRYADIFGTELNTGHGKRRCSLDLDDAEQRATLLDLAADADVVVNGYRAGSLERHGLEPSGLAERSTRGLVYVSINCYGHDGPWAQRRGWEQMAQTVSGLSWEQGPGDRPLKLPALEPDIDVPKPAPTDYVTGYLAAYGAVLALGKRAREGGSWQVRVSLCRTAEWFRQAGRVEAPEEAPGFGDISRLMQKAPTRLGELTHLRPAVSMSETPTYWSWPAMSQDESLPTWR